MHFDYANILIFFALGLALCGLMMGLGAALRPANPERSKLTTYECGEVVTGASWINFNIRFYLVALIFVVFDVEVVFVFPWASRFGYLSREFGVFAIAEMAVFIGILLTGWLYAWRKGSLEWS